MIVKAPFTPEQVKSLNDYQDSGVFHPFTCECRANLIATEKGWICNCCNYTQNWAHDFMLDGSWRQFEIQFRRPNLFVRFARWVISFCGKGIRNDR